MSSVVRLHNNTANPDRHARRTALTRSKIEEAAYELFKQQGIESVSIETICVAADIARRTFYSHYPNKQALIGALGVSRVWNNADPMIEHVLSTHNSTRQRLQALFEFIKDGFSSWDNIDRQLILWAPSSFINRQPDEQQHFTHGVTASFVRLIEEGLRIGDIHISNSAEIIATALIGTLNTLTLNWAIDPDYPITSRLDETEALFQGLLNPRPDRLK